MPAEPAIGEVEISGWDLGGAPFAETTRIYAKQSEFNVILQSAVAPNAIVVVRYGPAGAWGARRPVLCKVSFVHWLGRGAGYEVTIRECGQGASDAE